MLLVHEEESERMKRRGTTRRDGGETTDDEGARDRGKKSALASTSIHVNEQQPTTDQQSKRTTRPVTADTPARAN